MNCKPGEMAIVVKVDPDGVFASLLGKIVTVTDLCTGASSMFNFAAWHYEGESLVVSANGLNLALHALPDRCLRPLRDSDKDDETLKWAPVPEGVPA